MPSPFDFRSPWSPAPLRGFARSMAQWWATAGGAPAEYIARQLGRFYGMAGQLAGRMAAAAVDYAGRVASAFGAGGAGRMQRGQIYRNPSIPESYRVVVNARLRDPEAPPGSRDPAYTTWRTLVLDFSNNPSAGDIRKAAREMLAFLSDEAGSPRAKDVSKWRFMGLDVITIERRT